MEKNLQNIMSDTFDRLAWEGLRKKSDVLTQKVCEGLEYSDVFPNLAQDIFSSLYKGDPVLTEETPQGTELNRRHLEALMESEEYDNVRTYTMFDDFSSALAASDIMTGVIEEFQKNPPPKPPKGGDGGDEGGDDEGKGGDPAPVSPHIIRQAIRRGVKKAEKRAEENEEIFAALGCGTESAERKKMSFEDKENLLEQYRKVQKMAQYIGKYRNLSTSARSERVKDTKTELCGVTMGNSVIHALPQELSNLNHPVLQYEFFRKMQEHQLLQYELEVDDPVGMGSIVCLVDDSSSMYPSYGSQNNEAIARGIMFGLLECAKKDKRNFAANIFSYGNDNFSMEIPEGQYTPNQMLELLTISYCGGTSYEEPLTFAMETIGKDKFKNADIVMITDDCCRLSDKFIEKLNQFKKEHDVKVTMINIGGYIDSENTKQWVDNIYKDMGDETITEVFKGV